MPRGPQDTGNQRVPIKTSYDSEPVDIPSDFLRSTPHDAKPVVYNPIDFSKTALVCYKPAYAVILDNVLSPSECSTLLRLAESSVKKDSSSSEEEEKGKEGEEEDPWRPALVNIGNGYEVAVPHYRNSDRIIWDSEEIVSRLWSRITNHCPEIESKLSSFGPGDLQGYGYYRKDKPPPYWDFHAVNKRMRFLRYGPGQFFSPHCDGSYGEEGPGGEVLRTHFTMHLYLNDSRQSLLGEGEFNDYDECLDGEEEWERRLEGTDLEGGATSFFNPDESKKLDVDPRLGRVLIFQHKLLLHSGDEVRQGTKYTVRTDIMYKLRRGD